MEKVSLQIVEKEILLLCHLLDQIRLLSTQKKENSEQELKKNYAKYMFLINKLSTQAHHPQELIHIENMINTIVDKPSVKIEQTIKESIKKKIQKDLRFQIEKKNTEQLKQDLKKETPKKIKEENLQFDNTKPPLPKIEDDDEVEINIPQQKKKNWSKTDIVDFVKNNPNNKPKQLIEAKAKIDLQNYIAKLRKINPSKLEKIIFSFLQKKKL